MQYIVSALILFAAPATQPPPLPAGVSSFGAVTAAGQVYVYGGHVGKAHTYSTETVSGSFRRFTPPNGPWEELPSGTALQGLNLAEHRGIVYRVGGMAPRNRPGEAADNHSTAEAARFDPTIGRWEPLPPLPDGRSSHDVVVVEDRLVVVGGWKMAGKQTVWHDTILTLDLNDPKANWKSLPQPFRRRALIAAAHEGKVYVLGGLTSDNDLSRQVDIFDPKTQTWTEGPDYPGPELNGFSPAAAIWEGSLVLSTADGQVFRFTKSQWEPVATLAAPRYVHRLVVAGGELLAIGGAAPTGNVSLTEIVRVGAKDSQILHYKIVVPSEIGNKPHIIPGVETFSLVESGQAVQVRLAELQANSVPAPADQLLKGRSGYALIRKEPNTIWVIGGREATGELARSILAWNPTTGSVTPTTHTLPQGRAEATAALIDDTLFIAGGTGSGDSLNITTGQWNTFPAPASGSQLAALHGQLYAGRAGQSIERFQANEWVTVLKSLPTSAQAQLLALPHRLAWIEPQAGSVRLTVVDLSTRPKERTVAPVVAEAAPAPAPMAAKQEYCPVMTNTPVGNDSEEVEWNGVKVKLCCDTCIDKWKREPEAYLLPEFLPQLRGKTLPARPVTQVYCPVTRSRVVGAKDPWLEYKGVRIYFFNDAARRRFEKEPEKYLNAALLPQLQGR